MCNDEVEDCLHIYYDGSRKDDHTGYGFGVVDGDHLIHEEQGYLGDATVFQAEVVAIGAACRWLLVDEKSAGRN